MGLGADTARDAASQTFAKALAGLAEFDGDACAPWLFRIADNTCRDHALGVPRPTVPLPDEIALADPEVDVFAASELRELESELRRLTLRRERIVRLRLAGMKGKEIGLRLGIPTRSFARSRSGRSTISPICSVACIETRMGMDHGADRELDRRL
jgi:DNA-directed RNA polymerase specialized sigma24 family protein